MINQFESAQQQRAPLEGGGGRGAMTDAITERRYGDEIQ